MQIIGGVFVWQTNKDNGPGRRMLAWRFSRFLIGLSH